MCVKAYPILTDAQGTKQHHLIAVDWVRITGRHRCCRAGTVEEKGRFRPIGSPRRLPFFRESGSWICGVATFAWRKLPSARMPVIDSTMSHASVGELTNVCLRA